MMKYFTRCSAVLIFGLASMGAMAQRNISGTITGADDNLPLPGVNVVIKGTETGTITDFNGNYSIEVEDSNTLIFSFVGYLNQEILVGSQTSINVALEPDVTALEEVVVVAYGTQQKKDLTGTITSVSAKDFQKGNIASTEALLVGKVAGLQITSGGGSAGGGSTIRVRGGASLNASNDPLIVIDGVPVEGNKVAGNENLLNTINPNDIESISVLKDASSTALYGSRASNGVLIITTKKGLDSGIKMNFNTMFSLGLVAKTVDVLSGDQIREIVNQNAKDTNNDAFSKLLGKENTDWQKEIYRPAIGWDNNLSVSTAILNKIPLRASIGYFHQDGVLLTNNFNRLSGSLNLSPKFFEGRLAVNLNVKGIQTRYRFADENAVRAAASFDPTQPLKANNEYGGNFEWLSDSGFPIGVGGGSSQPNPLSLLQFRENNSLARRVIGNIKIDYELHFVPNLHFIVNLGLDKTLGQGNDNKSSILVTDYNTDGRHKYYKEGKSNMLADVQIYYSKQFDDIKTKFDVLVGHTYQDFYTDKYNFAEYSEFGELIPGTTPTFATDKPQNRLESYLGRINATLFDKYLLTAAIRRDASSKFSKENRVGYFPSVAVAWKLKEQFFKNSGFVSDLKLRAGWGVTGQQDGIDNYAYQPRYVRSESVIQYNLGGSSKFLFSPRPYDPNIKWESTTTRNIGLDFNILKERLSGSVEVYDRKTNDLLANVDVAPGTNFDVRLTTNVGNVEVKGLEFNINGTLIRSENINWDLGLNFTRFVTEVTNLTKTEDPNFPGFDVGNISGGTGNTIGKITVGEAPYSFYVKKQIYDNAGNPIEGLYEDINRDGVGDDRYIFKKPAPDFMLGFTSSLSYKKLNVGFAFHGSFGNYLYNNYQAGNGVLNAIKNPATFISNASSNYSETKFSNQQYLSDYYIQNASFLRWDNLNIGYNLGKFIKNADIAGSVTFSIQNVAVFTKYKGLDPEVEGDTDAKGVDNAIYPRPRVFSVRFNLDF